MTHLAESTVVDELLFLHCEQTKQLGSVHQTS